MAGDSESERGRAAEPQEKSVLRKDEGGKREGESWLKEPEELRGMILSKRKNPESPSDAKKIRKAKNSEIRGWQRPRSKTWKQR